jgi:hypothetical protein
MIVEHQLHDADWACTIDTFYKSRGRGARGVNDVDDDDSVVKAPTIMSTTTTSATSVPQKPLADKPLTFTLPLTFEPPLLPTKVDDIAELEQAWSEAAREDARGCIGTATYTLYLRGAKRVSFPLSSQMIVDRDVDDGEMTIDGFLLSKCVREAAVRAYAQRCEQEARAREERERIAREVAQRERESDQRRALLKSVAGDELADEVRARAEALERGRTRVLGSAQCSRCRRADQCSMYSSSDGSYLQLLCPPCGLDHVACNEVLRLSSKRARRE